MTQRSTHFDLDLAYAIAGDGAAAHHDALVGLARRVAPVWPTLATVLADPTAPDVARQRAFGMASAPRCLGSATLAHTA